MEDEGVVSAELEADEVAGLDHVDAGDVLVHGSQDNLEEIGTVKIVKIQERLDLHYGCTRSYHELFENLISKFLRVRVGRGCCL